MKLLDLTLTSPAENLACDEALLNRAEAEGGEILRFWEPREHFVVVGYANKVEREVKVAACAAKHIPIFRRCSGGGTVLQGPGCLNYALILQIVDRPPLANISDTNQFIMERNREAVQSVIADGQSRISVCGHTDLALSVSHSPPGAQRKCSGNSQRRQKRALLFHGTCLLNFDLALVGELLPMPSRQPDYRDHRGHADFLINLNRSAARIKAALGQVWNADEATDDFPDAAVQALAREKYSLSGWNFKW